MPEEIERLNYYQLQFLGAEDFQAEQVYHRDMRRRHSTGQHTWGIVTGLELTQTARAGSNPPAFDIFVQPGIAIDGFGREIVVGAPYKLDASDLQFLKPISSTTSPPPLRNVTVHIAYGEEQASPPAFGYGTCDGHADGNAQNDRVRELFRIVMNAKPPFHAPVRVDGRDLAESALPSDGSVPHQELPDTATTRWLVPLGSVGWNATGQVFGDSAALLAKDRVYAGVVAEDVIAPAGELRIRRRKAPADVDADDFAVVEGRLEVQGELHADRKVVIDGDLEEKSDIILGGKLSFDTPGAVSDPVALTMERYSAAPGENDLRIRIGKGPKNRLTIGPPPEPAIPNPTLTVRGDDRVDIESGTLSFGTTLRQMVDLSTAKYGIGVQTGTLYQRSDSEFAWFRGGSHASGSPTTGGTRVMHLSPTNMLTVAGAIQANSLSVTGDLGVDGMLRLLVKGGNNSDELAITRHLPDPINEPNRNELRIILGDDLDDVDSLTIGPISWVDSAYKPNFRVTNTGKVFAMGDVTAEQNLLVKQNATLQGAATVNGAFIANSTLTANGTASVTGNLSIGGNVVLQPGSAIHYGGLERFPLDIKEDVILFAGVTGVSQDYIFTVKSRLPSITDAFIHLALAGIRNEGPSMGAGWNVQSVSKAIIAPNECQFTIKLVVGDTDGYIEAISYLVIFVP